MSAPLLRCWKILCRLTEIILRPHGLHNGAGGYTGGQKWELSGVQTESKRLTEGSFAARAGYEVAAEFPDDGVIGKLPMHARPQGRLLIAALLGDGIKIVLCYDAKRIGRTQPAFWSFVGMCRDNGVTVLDSAGTDLTSSVMGGVNGMLAEMDRDATVARLAAGKAHWRGTRRVEGRWPYGEHPSHEHDAERAVVARIKALHVSGVSSYAIARRLNAEDTRTRYGKEFTTTTVQNILRRFIPSPKESHPETACPEPSL